jgi:3-oxoacyl-[acyl-carrier protein] reductase
MRERSAVLLPYRAQWRTGTLRMKLDIDGKTGLVTGASSGIGRGIALALAAEGVRLAIVARRRHLLQQLAAEITAAGGADPVVIECDLMQAEAAAAIAHSALDGLGSVDILVNNAGGSRRFALDASEAQWDEAPTLNFTRQRQLAHQLLGQMMQRNWGRIINITGKSEPEGINGAFCAKAAMHSWAKGLSREVGRHGITVNSIPHGRIMSEQILRNYTPEYRQWQADNESPVGAYGEPEDIAQLVCFLASPRARYITGAVIPVDGGLRRYQF